jgi:hypothetical protein
MKKYGKKNFEEHAHEGKKLNKNEGLLPSASSDYNKEVDERAGQIKKQFGDKKPMSIGEKIKMIKKQFLKKSLIPGGKNDKDKEKPSKDFKQTISDNMDGTAPDYDPAKLGSTFKKKLQVLLTKKKNELKKNAGDNMQADINKAKVGGGSGSAAPGKSGYGEVINVDSKSYVPNANPTAAPKIASAAPASTTCSAERKFTDPSCSP